jgi:hypothetical protein
VEPNAHKIVEHRRKYERLRKEREEKRAQRDRLRQRAEAQVIHTKALRQASSISLWRMLLTITSEPNGFVFYFTRLLTTRPRGRSNRQVAHQEVHLPEAFLEGCLVVVSLEGCPVEVSPGVACLGVSLGVACLEVSLVVFPVMLI